MDYVIAGFGIGAIVALVGFALWELYGNSDEPGRGWLTRASIGAMLGALVIWAVTGVTLISTLDDNTASNLVMATAIITILAIVAGTAWYWRADQALLASMPPQAVQKPRNQPAAFAPAAATTNVELSEWDSWPEREEPATDTPDAQPDTPAEPSFEPEVAAKPAVVSDDSPEGATETDTAVPEEAALIAAEDTVIAIEVEPLADSAADVPADTVAPAPVQPAPEIVDEPVPAAEVEAPIAALPANIPPRRNAKADARIELEKSKSTELPKPAADSTPQVNGNAGIVQPPKPETKPEAPQLSLERAPSAAFESSLLADIDTASVEGDGRYRSPLLADLEQNPDELEGVGLAKWRPDARLTADHESESPPPAKRRKRR